MLGHNMYTGVCTRHHFPPNDPNFLAGQFSTEEDHPAGKPQLLTSRHIKFKRPYTAPPNVVV